VLEIALPHYLADDYGDELVRATEGRIRLLPIVGGHPDLSLHL